LSQGLLCGRFRGGRNDGQGPFFDRWRRQKQSRSGTASSGVPKNVEVLFAGAVSTINESACV
jgi:hypothetical protein